MMHTYTSSIASRKLLLRFIMENIDYRKRSLYLQEIISMSRVNDVWRRALATFFDTPAASFSVKAFCKN
ncbi:hypothetical protein [Terrimonas alba]|uniref:hypothetical protein n=1 Tax=Terrimonas alba TaxID=3349636 RepID=UPI0035F4CEF8